MVIWKIGIGNNKFCLIILNYRNKLPSLPISILIYKIKLFVLKNYNSGRVYPYTSIMLPNRLKIFGVYNVCLLKKDDAAPINHSIKF
jgi:hypothetical protein